MAIKGANALRVNDSAIVMEGAKSTSQNAPFSSNPLVNYISFVCIEFALYMIFMAWKYRKSAIYYVTFASLLVIPLLKIGGKHDFSMRASIPALIMVFILVSKFLIEERGVLKNTEVACESKKSKDTASLKKLTYILLVVFLILGTLTPAMEF